MSLAHPMLTGILSLTMCLESSARFRRTWPGAEPRRVGTWVVVFWLTPWACIVESASRRADWRAGTEWME